jgi:hypothetical protein
MLKRICFYSALIIMLTSCNNDRERSGSIIPPQTAAKKSVKQINISILWDLSDRINPAVHPELPRSSDKDISIIHHFAEFLKADMDSKGAFLAKGKLKVFFSPAPNDPQITTMATKLDVDLSTVDIQGKKMIYDSIAAEFSSTARTITEQTIKTSTWNGSDIYRFFKNDVKDYCISKDTSTRNILVVLTDGYIYHPQSKGRINNKSEYILPALLNSLGLRNNPNYKSTISSKSCGLISTRSDLNNLEVLVLEINSEPNFKNDEDIIKTYLQQWFADMNVKRFEIYNTDLPENTKRRISNFMNYEIQ